MPDAFARLICKLLAEGRVARSQFSDRSLKALRSLFDAGVLIQERSGGGMAVVLENAAALRSFYKHRYPNAELTLGASPRASAVGTFRNAKRTRRTDLEPVLMRALRPLVATRDGLEYDLLATSRLAGSACLMLEAEHFWSLSGRLAIVENLECFLHFEKMSIPVDAILYAAGRLSQLALQWLASEPMSECSFLHFGDYDPVGLDEFLRLKRAVGLRAELHIPDNLRELVTRYGRPELLADSARVLQRLRATSDPSVRQVLGILDETGCGLEQEALLLD
jgi:hypothetical protein